MLTKIIILFIAYTIHLNAFGQVDATNYKSIADKYLEAKSNKKFYEKLKFKSFYSTDTDEGDWYFEADQLKSNTIDSFVSITFQYSFFSKKLNTTLDFEVTLNRDSTINNAVDLSCYIPECILQDNDCDLMTKDQAIAIAKKSKIKYSTDFQIELTKPINKREYYWYIIGFNYKISKSLNKQTPFRFTANQQRIINARTGEVISYEDFRKDD